MAEADAGSVGGSRRINKLTEGLRDSGAFEVFFSMSGETPVLQRPLYFHHIPKTGGTSLREAIRQFMIARKRSMVRVPKIRDRANRLGRWPAEMIGLFNALSATATIEVVASHYTARLADGIKEPIVAVLRKPEDQFLSAVAFSAGFLARARDGDETLEAVLRTRFGNIQTRSLTGLDIPASPPSTMEERDKWRRLADRLVSRFTLLPGYAEAMRHFATYGLELEERRNKVRKRSDGADRLVSVAKDLLTDDRSTPVWLDRMLYERVSAAAIRAA